MKKIDVYAEEPEILAIVHVIKRPIRVNYSGTVPRSIECGEAYIHIINYPIEILPNFKKCPKFD